MSFETNPFKEMESRSLLKVCDAE